MDGSSPTASPSPRRSVPMGRRRTLPRVEAERVAGRELLRQACSQALALVTIIAIMLAVSAL